MSPQDKHIAPQHASPAVRLNLFENVKAPAPTGWTAREQIDLSWTELCDRLESLTRRTAREKTKLPAFTLGTLTDPYAIGRNYLNHTALAIDVDSCPQETLDALDALGLALFAYASPSDPNPDGTRRVRIVAELSEPIAPGDVEQARFAFAELLDIGPGQGVETAKSVPQMMFAGRLHGSPARDTWRFAGEPLDAAALVAAPLALAWRTAPKLRAVPALERVAIADPDERTAALLEALAPYWAELEAHRDVLRGLGGYLARRGWPDEQIAAFAVGLAPERPVTSRVALMLETARAARLDDNAAGWTSLVAWSPEAAAVIESVAKDPREPDGFPGVWVPAFAKMFERAAAARPSNDTRRDPMRKAGAPAADTAEPEHAGHDPAVDHVIARLADPACGVYQRAGLLVTINREAHNDQEIVRPNGAPTIRHIVPARLKEIIRMTSGPRDAILAGDVIARGEWSHIRPLDAIVTYPVLRRDGTILTASGYDHSTRTLADMRVGVRVPDRPTIADARAALAVLTDLVSDFPFEAPAHRSAWLAALLTVPARPAIEGPTPMLLLDASARGSGKTMLADLISIITTGEDATRRTAPETAEEWRKVIYAMLLAGDPICLIDNVTRMLASAALDAMLTGTTYKDRVLGVSEERSIAVRTVMIASANNCRVSSDLVRRSLHCRIDPNVERPELRTGFQIPDLLAHARRERAALLGAALTIVRAYAAAGRPAVKARPMGSYGAWCSVVRDALVWAGGGDPAETQDALREDADVERDELRDLLTAWHRVLGDQAVTVRELLEAARTGRKPDRPGDKPARVTEPGGRFAPAPAAADALADALRGIMPSGVEPSTHAVGKRLQSLRSGRSGGLVLRQRGIAHGGGKRWQVASE